MQKKNRITVIGDCGWDYTFVMQPDGTYPEKPTFSSPGLKGANQAVAASRGGAEVFMIGMIGADAVGKKVIQNFKKQKVNTKCIGVTGEVPTDHYNMFISLDGENSYSGRPLARKRLSIEVINAHKDLILSSSLVITTAHVNKDVVIYLTDFCYENNIKIIFTSSTYKFNVKDDWQTLKKMTHIMANEKELLNLTGTGIEEALALLPNLIATKGAEGVFLSQGGKMLHIPALKVPKVVDTTGAGDTFLGFFAASMVSGKFDFLTCIRRGIAASTLKIQKKGAQISMPAEKEVSKAYPLYFGQPS